MNRTESSDSQSLALRTAKALKPNLMLKALSGAPILWAFLADDGTTARHIHRALFQEEWRDAGWRNRAVLIAGFVARVPAIMAATAMLTRRCGPRVRRATGKGLFRQAGEQLSLAFGKAVLPPWYYMFELHDGARGANALAYLYRFETKAALYHSLRDWLSDPATVAALSDKSAFAKRCVANGLAAIAVLAEARAGKVVRTDGVASGLPRRDLFLKPLRGAGGRGASRWLCAEDGRYHGNMGSVLDEQAMLAYVAELSRTEDYVVRARVTNHPELADLAGSVLSTVRVVTCLDEQGRAEITHAALRMAINPDVVVDNFHVGGIAAAVDIGTGQLGPASDMGLRADSRWWDTHPVSGAPIAGRRLPMWPQVRDLALAAHAAFDGHVAIGWDIAICAEGPMLVEGNKSPDLDIVQRVWRAPLGNSRFAELLWFHIQRAQGVKSASAMQ